MSEPLTENDIRQTELHNVLGPQIAALLLQPLRQGGDYADVMVLTESVVAGVICSLLQPIGDVEAVKSISDGIAQRLADMRLQRAQAQGRA